MPNFHCQLNRFATFFNGSSSANHGHMLIHTINSTYSCFRNRFGVVHDWTKSFVAALVRRASVSSVCGSVLLDIPREVLGNITCIGTDDMLLVSHTTCVTCP